MVLLKVEDGELQAPVTRIKPARAAHVRRGRSGKVVQGMLGIYSTRAPDVSLGVYIRARAEAVRGLTTERKRHDFKADQVKQPCRCVSVVNPFCFDFAAVSESKVIPDERRVAGKGGQK